MPPAVAKIRADALALSPAERAELAHDLLVSLDDDASNDGPNEVAAAWVTEIERRVADLDAGRSRTVPMAEAMARIRDRLRAQRDARNR